jgi:hypothetical protein
MNEGHGFSPCGRFFSIVLCRLQLREESLRSVRLEKRTSAAKAVKREAFDGTAEAVPFVRRCLFPQPFKVSESFSC